MSMKDKIKDRRTELGLTQEQLADKLGLQKSAIAKYENGRVENIKRSVIVKMAQVLECSPCYLLDMDLTPASVSLNQEEKDLVDGYRLLNDTGKKQLHKQLSMMLNDDEYRKDTDGSQGKMA